MQFLIYNVEIEYLYTAFLLGQTEEEILNLKEEIRRLTSELEEEKRSQKRTEREFKRHLKRRLGRRGSWMKW